MRSDFNFYFDDALKTCNITDLNLGGMSVTNNAESVVNEIYSEDNRIKEYHILYSDSEGAIDKILPKWKDDKCIDVSFECLNLLDFKDFVE